MPFETTSTLSVPEFQGRLSDREIENRSETPLSVEEHFARWEQEMNPTPPIWEGRDFSHETVQAPAAQQIEAQPSIVEQHDAMTDSQYVEYIDAITSHVAARREVTLSQNLPVYRSDFDLAA